MKKCSGCGFEKPLSEYNKNPSAKDGLRQLCRDCHRATARRWYYENRERALKRVREYNQSGYYRRWYEANREYARAKSRQWKKDDRERASENEARRRARKKNAPNVERIDRGYVYERDGGRCHLCGKDVPRERFTLDHLVPLSKGGDHTHENLAIAHLSCNSARGDGRIAAQLLLVG